MTFQLLYLYLQQKSPLKKWLYYKEKLTIFPNTQGTQIDILRGNLFGYKSAIFENLVADIFTKKRRKLYYFRKDSGLEVDFVIRYEGECTLIEVKASSGNVKSTKTILAHPEKYHVHHAIKLGDVNIGQSGQMTILPLYMDFLLDKT